MFQSILIIFRMLLTINKNLHKNKKKDGLLNILKFVHKMFVDIVKWIGPWDAEVVVS